MLLKSVNHATIRLEKGGDRMFFEWFRWRKWRKIVYNKIYMTDEEIRAAGIEFAKHNKERLAKELTDPKKYASEVIPISVFMAGSPGAGKTEFSKNLIALLEKNNERRVVRIDGDEVRPLMQGYAGNNSHLFQGAVSFPSPRLLTNSWGQGKQ